MSAKTAPAGGGGTQLVPLIPATALVVFVILLPQLLMFRYSLNQYDPAKLMIETLTLENYALAILDPFYQEVLLRTLVVAGISTAVCLVLGFPLAYWISRVSSARLKTLLILMVVIPLLVGNAARTVGWIVLVSDGGAINSALMSLGIMSEPFKIMNTGLGVVISLVSILLPYMVIAMQSVLEGIDQSLEEAALSLGASAWTSTRRIVIPLAMPGIYAGAVLTFVLAMGAYAAPVFIGGPTFHMMAPKVYEQIVTVNNWPMGSTLSFLLLAVTLIITVVVTKLLQRRYGQL